MNDLQNVKERIAECLASNIKAYDLEIVCASYGLDGIDRDSAWRSKRICVLNALKNKLDDEIFILVRKIIKDYSCIDLTKVAYNYFDRCIFEVSSITRRELLDRFLFKEKFVEIDQLTGLLSEVWELESMPSTDSRLSNAKDDITQHMVTNYDWEFDFLFEEYLEFFYVSDKKLIRLIETIVHPRFNKNSSQKKLVDCLNIIIAKDGLRLEQVGEKEGHAIFKCLSLNEGVKSSVKNLIFASSLYKPEIVISDALANDIKIVKNEEYCLVYDLAVKPDGLLWRDLVIWWSKRNSFEDLVISGRSLYKRLFESLNSAPEKLIFKFYFEKFHKKLGEKLPALIPQVYLHYDPYTLKSLQGEKRLPRQRMDFLLLLPNKNRVVLEVDGKQHYSEGEKSSPRLYSEMVSEDRSLRLRGYEVYRFGGYELDKDLGRPDSVLSNFFENLFQKHNIF